MKAQRKVGGIASQYWHITAPVSSHYFVNWMRARIAYHSPKLNHEDLAMLRLLASFFLICTLATASLIADTIQFKGGGNLTCSVIQELPNRVTAIYGQGLLSFDREKIASIEKSTTSAVACPEAIDQLPTWEVVMRCVAAQSWSDNFRQISATVVTTGPLARVPYKSHKCGDWREINVYGDPAAPSGFEIGLYDAHASDKEEQDRSIKWFVSLLPKDRRAIIEGLPREGGKVEHEGTVYEITPPTASDAFGGWWISAYNAKKTDKARATKEELKSITQDRTKAKAETAKSKDLLDRLPSIIVVPVPVGPSDQSPPAQAAEGEEDNAVLAGQNYDEVPRSAAVREKKAEPANSTGDVYVQGYYRKDGTYVRGHSRRRR